MVSLPVQPAAREVTWVVGIRSESGLESGLESGAARDVRVAPAAGSLGRSEIAEKLGHAIWGGQSGHQGATDKEPH